MGVKDDDFMRVHASPFRPGYGERPEVLAGRDDLLHSIHRGVLTSTSYQLALYGPRGVGKTAILRDLEEWADARDWLAVSHQVAPGQPTGSLIVDKLHTAARELPGSWRQRVSDTLDELGGISLAGVGLSRRPGPERAAATLEKALTGLGKLAVDAERGVLLLLDEIQSVDPGPELVALTQAFQALRGRYPVHVIVAGLHTPDLGGTRGATFFERIARESVGFLDDPDAREALLGPISRRDVPIHAQALDNLQHAAGGYPFFVQLFGHHTWEAWVTDGATGAITTAHVRTGFDRAAALVNDLFAVRWGRLGPQTQEFLTAMAAEGASASRPAALAAIGRRLDRDPNSLGQLRDSVISRHQLVTSAGRGQLRFTIPFFERWILEHAHQSAPDPFTRHRLDPPSPDPGIGL